MHDVESIFISQSHKIVTDRPIPYLIKEILLCVCHHPVTASVKCPSAKCPSAKCPETVTWHLEF